MSGRTLAIVVLALSLAAPLFAGDIVAMPTGNTVAPGNLELNAIRWGRGPDGIYIGEAFVGVVDRLEIDVDWADLKGVDNFTEVNAYATLIKETPNHPSVIFGCTNVFGSDWLPAAKYPSRNNNPSFLGVSSYNLAVPKNGPPTWKTPVVRLQLGWGSGWHDDEWFGGVQMLFHPRLGAAVFNYKSMPAYMATWKATKNIEATAGFLGGDNFYRIGGFLTW